METNLKFADIEQDLLDKLKTRNLHITEPVSLLKGFSVIYSCEELSTSGPESFNSKAPAIALYGMETGRIYYVALKSLFPDVLNVQAEPEEETHGVS